MHKLILYIFLFIFFRASAQDTLNSKFVEERSYQLYLEKINRKI